MVKKPRAKAGDTRGRCNPRVRKIPWSRKWQPILVSLLGKFHGQRSLTGYSPWVTKSQTQLSMHIYKRTANSLTVIF